MNLFTASTNECGTNQIEFMKYNVQLQGRF